MVLNTQWRYDLIEVKAKSGIRKNVSDHGQKKKLGAVESLFIDDVSFQSYVIDHALQEDELPPLGNKYIYYLNKEYCKQWPLDMEKLLRREQVDIATTVTVVQKSKEVEKIREDYLLDHETIAWIVQTMKKELPLSSDQFALIHPFPGNKYLEYFGEEKPFGTIMGIPGSPKSSVVAALYEEGVHDIQSLNDEQIKQFYGNSWPGSAGKFIYYYLDCIQKGQPLINRDAIKKELGALTFPLCFYDYESVSVPVPFMEKTYPYQQVVVQYSLHKYYQDGRMEHFGGILWGLATDKKVEKITIAENPNRVAYESEKIIYGSYKDLLDEFLNDIGEDIANSSFIVRHQWFENARNKEAAILFDDIADSYLTINEQTFDLKEIFSKRYYFDLACKGSSSIKKVLPVLVPHMSYDNLAISKGDAAMKALAHILQWKTSSEEKQQTLIDLLLYCGQDSLAMVRIYEALKKTIIF